MRRAADRPNALRAATAPGKASTCSLSSPPCMLNVFIKEYRVYKVYKKVHYCKMVIKLKTPLNVRRSYVNMGACSIAFECRGAGFQNHIKSPRPLKPGLFWLFLVRRVGDITNV